MVAALNLPVPEAAAQTLLQYFVIVDQVGTQRTNYDSTVPIASQTVDVLIRVVDAFKVRVNQNGFKMRVLVDEQPLGPAFDVTALPATATWDTRAISDGVHVLSAEILDTPSNVQLIPFPTVVVVNNTAGPVTGPQPIPVCPAWHLLTGLAPNRSGPKCDWVTYEGRPPVLRGYPQPVVRGSPLLTTPKPSDLYVEHIAPVLELFEKNHQFFQTTDSHVVAMPFNTKGGEHYERNAAPFVDRMPLRDGPRNVGYVTAYINGVVHPVTEGLIFAELGEKRGRVGQIALDGTVRTLAGFRMKSGGLPYLPGDLTIPETLRAQQYEKVGVFQNGPPQFSRPMDVTIDPRNANIIYVADSGNHRIARMDISRTPAVVTTYAGSLTGQAGWRDGVGTAALFDEPFSIVMTKNATMYVADHDNSLIRQITPTGQVTTLVGQGFRNIPPQARIEQAPRADNRAAYMVNGDWSVASIIYPFVIRLDSHENLILGENFLGTIRRLNLASQTVELLRLPQANAQWIWLDVDQAGTFGPKDDIFFASSTAAKTTITEKNTYVVRLPADGSAEQVIFKGSYDLDGRANMVRVPHYPWMVAVGKGALWVSGFGTGITRVRQAQPQDRVDTLNELYDYYSVGARLYWRGTVAGFPWGARPSMAHIHGFYGSNMLGVGKNFDDLNTYTDAELAALIQSGGDGQTPRPEITGNDLRNLIYFLRRQSLPAVRSGMPLLGLSSSDKTPPAITNVVVTQLAADRVQITWGTSEPTLGVIKFGPSATNYYRWSGIENAYTLLHIAVLEDLERGKAYHFSITVRDQAGNQMSTLDDILGTQ